jgi:hypothetical protein
MATRSEVPSYRPCRRNRVYLVLSPPDSESETMSHETRARARGRHRAHTTCTRMQGKIMKMDYWSASQLCVILPIRATDVPLLPDSDCAQIPRAIDYSKRHKCKRRDLASTWICFFKLRRTHCHSRGVTLLNSQLVVNCRVLANLAAAG